MDNSKVNQYSQRFRDYLTDSSPGPWQELESRELGTLVRYLWENKVLSPPYFPSVKEVDFYFRDWPKVEWISENELLDMYEKAQKILHRKLKMYLEEHFHTLSLPQKIHFLRFLLKEASLDEKKLYFLGKDYLILDHSLKELSEQKLRGISCLFSQFELKFHEVKHA